MNTEYTMTIALMMMLLLMMMMNIHLMATEALVARLRRPKNVLAKNRILCGSYSEYSPLVSPYICPH